MAPHTTEESWVSPPGTVHLCQPHCLHSLPHNMSRHNPKLLEQCVPSCLQVFAWVVFAWTSPSSLEIVCHRLCEVPWEAHMHLGVTGLMFVFGDMGSVILTLYWINIYLRLFSSFPKWKCPVCDKVTACSSEVSPQDFLSNFCSRVC